MELGPELPNQNVAGPDFLTAKLLHAPSLASAVTTVSGASACFFMCHGSIPPLMDR
jgi:hypothetical protein